MVLKFKHILVASTVAATSVSATAQAGTAAPMQAGLQDQQLMATAQVFSEGDQLKFQSKALGEERSLLVYKPESYKKNKDATYPVIYLLDGPSHFDHTIAAMKYMVKEDRMPEAIIVGIPNLPSTRRRDMLDKPINFTKFIKSEVMPHIEGNYRTNDQKTLFGHSLAGRFALFFMSEHKDIFQNYIAGSPALQGDDFIDVKMLVKNLKANDEGAPTVYFAVGQGERAGFIGSVDTFKKALEGGIAPDMKWKAEYIPTLDHSMSPYVSAYRGLQYVYSDYSDPVFASVAEYEKAGEMSAIEAHYKNRAVKYGLEDKIPQTAIIAVANLYAGEGKHKKAVEIFEYNQRANPESLRANFNLARGYQAAGMHEKSVEYFQISLELDAKSGGRNKTLMMNMLEQAKARVK